MQEQKTLGYVRVVVTQKGNLEHICPNTLHHPDPDEQERLNRFVTVDMLNDLFQANSECQKYNDCQVLVLFHPNEEQLTIETTMMIQPGFKQFWRERITRKLEKPDNTLRDEVHLQSRIELWENTYNEAFVPAWPIK